MVKIDPANGDMTVINSEFKTPAAANLDGKGNLWVVDTKTGELCRVELATGRKTVVKQLKPALDNLAIAPDGTVYVSNMANNSIEAYNPANGELRLLTGGKLAVPAGLKIVAESAAQRLVEIDPADGTRRTVADKLPIGLPGGPGMPPPYVVTGVAVGADGSIYMSADLNNAIYRIRPQR